MAGGGLTPAPPSSRPPGPSASPALSGLAPLLACQLGGELFSRALAPSLPGPVPGLMAPVSLPGIGVALAALRRDTASQGIGAARALQEDVEAGACAGLAVTRPALLAAAMRWL